MPPESYDKDLAAMITKYEEDYKAHNRLVGLTDVPLDTTEVALRNG